MIKNEHKVFGKQWNAWNEHAKAVFNGTYEDILSQGSSIFLNNLIISDQKFKLMAWNAAWTAAHQSHKIDERQSSQTRNRILAAAKKILHDPNRSKRAMVAAGKSLSAPGPR